MKTNTIHASTEFEQYPGKRESQPIDRRAATTTGLVAAFVAGSILTLQAPVLFVCWALLALILLTVLIERAIDAGRA